MAEKIYCGNGKAFGNYGQIGVSVCLTDLPKKHITEYNGKKYIKLKISPRKEVDKYGNTHSVEVDTWKPEPKPATPPKVDEFGELPF